MRTFIFSRPNVQSIASTVILGFFSVLLIYVPVAQFFAGAKVQYVILVAYPMLGFFWYIVLKPARKIELSSTAEILVKRGLGTRRIPISSIRTIRPWFNLSRKDFVVEYTGGSELLFGNPVEVRALAEQLSEQNNHILIRGINPLPQPSAIPARPNST